MSDDWRASAGCRGLPLDMFFPQKGQTSESQEIQYVLRACRRCFVKEQCLREALDIEGDCARRLRHGIWGGKTPEQRHVIVHGPRQSKKRDDNLCSKGLHEMDDSNVYVQPSGYRECRACRSVIRERYEQRKRAG